MTLYFFFLRAEQARRLAVLQNHVGAKRRAESTQSSDGGLFFCGVSFFRLLFLGGLSHETLHAEPFRTVGVEQFQRSDFVSANYASNACESEFQFFRLRRR